MKYIWKKLWHLIILLITAAVAVIGGFKNWVLYPFLSQYFRFALFVLFFGLVSHFAGEALPRRFRFEKKPFAPYKWEKNGKFWQEKFHVKAWKDSLMDMGKTNATSSRELTGELDSKRLYGMIQESCAAETTHAALVVIGLGQLFINPLPWSVIWTLIYMLFNMLDIIVQRYNRPRLVSIYRGALRREERGTSL